MAAAKGCAPAQLALAWLLAQARTSCPSRTNHARNVEANVAAVDLTLTPAELGRLAAVFDRGRLRATAIRPAQ